jgi:hypothetical protein
MSHEQHHYVPAFLLREWESGPDAKLSALRWVRGAVHASRLKAKSVAKERHLYATGLRAGQPCNGIEAGFMGPKVDDPAAVAFRVLLSAEPDSLSEPQRQAWARFLVSLLIRLPRAVEHIQSRARHLVTQDGEPLTKPVLAGDGSVVRLADWILENEPAYIEEMGVRVLPRLTMSRVLNEPCLEATWVVRDLSSARSRLLIGDAPLIYEGRMDGTFSLALPLSPSRIFFAHRGGLTGERIQRLTHDGAVLVMNRTQAAWASTYVFATNDDLIPLVAKHLRRGR